MSNVTKPDTVKKIQWLFDSRNAVRSDETTFEVLEKYPSIDLLYGPYDSVADAFEALSEKNDNNYDALVIGKTVGIKQLDGSIKEYWFEKACASASDLVEKGGNSITIDDTLSSTSTNPVQNKVVNTALNNIVENKISKGAIFATYVYANREGEGSYVTIVGQDGDGGDRVKSILFTTKNLGEVAKFKDQITDSDGTVHDGSFGLNVGMETQNIKPKATGTYNLGNENKHWDSAYINKLVGANGVAIEVEDISTGGGSGITIDSVLSSTSENPVQNKVINSALSGKASTDIATTSANGLMSSSDKSKLDGIAAGAEKNPTVTQVLTSGTQIATIGNTPIYAPNGGSSVTVDSALSSTSENPVQNKIINTALAGKASTNVATTTTNGLMSATDKTKLDGIAEGAEANVNPDWNATSGDAQILNKPTIPNVNNRALKIDIKDYVGQTTEALPGVDCLFYYGATDNEPAKTLDWQTLLDNNNNLVHVFRVGYDNVTTPYYQYFVFSSETLKWSITYNSDTDTIPSYILDAFGKITVDSALNNTSTNPVQNKVVNTALNNIVENKISKGAIFATYVYANREGEGSYVTIVGQDGDGGDRVKSILFTTKNLGEVAKFKDQITDSDGTVHDGSFGLNVGMETQNIKPKATGTYNLGNENKHWDSAYINKLVGANGVAIEVDNIRFEIKDQLYIRKTEEGETETGSVPLHGTYILEGEPCDCYFHAGTSDNDVLEVSDAYYDDENGYCAIDEDAYYLYIKPQNQNIIFVFYVGKSYGAEYTASYECTIRDYMNYSYKDDEGEVKWVVNDIIFNYFCSRQVASTNKSGLMSASDKTKLDGIVFTSDGKLQVTIGGVTKTFSPDA